jgi:hypothetical protein
VLNPLTAEIGLPLVMEPHLPQPQPPPQSPTVLVYQINITTKPLKLALMNKDGANPQPTLGYTIPAMSVLNAQPLVPAQITCNAFNKLIVPT